MRTTRPAFVLLLASCLAQPVLHGQQLFTANESPTAEKLLAPRPLQYWVDDEGSIVCVDGQNRFTRALYGTASDGRLETSDMPEFGLYMPYMGGNVSFALPDGSHCLTAYDGVSRRYTISLPETLRKNAREEALVEIRAVAINDHSEGCQGGAWRIEGHNVKRSVRILMRYGAADNASFSRNGDIGVDKKGCFDFTMERCLGNIYDVRTSRMGGASSLFAMTYGQQSKRGERKIYGSLSRGDFELNDLGGSAFLTASLAVGDGEPIYLAIGHYDRTRSPQKTYDVSLLSAQMVGQTLRVTLPDATMQPLGYVLSAAADAIWDEEQGVWLHGAVGWRIALPGWRAAYVGDVLGQHKRADRHFSNYAASQLVDVDVDTTLMALDPQNRLARATERVGAPMFTTGYICRLPNSTSRVNHYDMNLVYIDELLWHLCWTGDWEMAARYWPTLQRHLDWEKRCFDPDGDHLYDAYCCIWASDALYYSGGAVTHSSAYNYRANKMAAEIARGLAERDTQKRDEYLAWAEQYGREAEAIGAAIDARLWMEDKGVWAECQDKLGLQRLHRSPALWTVYHAVDSEVGTPDQRRQATQYVLREQPRYPIVAATPAAATSAISFVENVRQGVALSAQINAAHYSAIATTNWQPYVWSINNVALAEEMHTALALWQAGSADEAWHLFKGALIDGMYLGASPGNIGQVSYYDAARGECYRDFGDPVGITTRTVVQGLFGICPDLLNDRIVLRPGFPSEWRGQPVSIETSDFRYGRNSEGSWYFEGKSEAFRKAEIVWDTLQMTSKPSADAVDVADIKPTPCVPQSTVGFAQGSEWPDTRLLHKVDLSEYYNLDVADLFAQQYLSPRSQTITLSLPVQGIGEWCHPKDTFAIARDLALKAAFTSRFDNFPTRIAFPVGASCAHVYMKMCGTTNAMQSRIANGVVRLNYTDGSQDSLELVNPVNWWPIDQELVQGMPAFYLQQYEEDVQAPLRMSLRTGEVYRPKATRLNQATDGGAANLIDLPADPDKILGTVEIETLSNDVIIGVIELYYQ